MKRGKKYLAATKKITADKQYTIEEAIELVKQTSPAKFDAAVEIHFRLGIDPKKGEQQVRGTIKLPHGTGKIKKVVVFSNDPKSLKDSGADQAGGQEIIDEIKKTGKCDFDVAVATPDIMKNLAVIARILGPRGLMPSPKNETITKNVKATVAELKKGKISYKNDDTANLHLSIGRVSFENKKLLENYKTTLETIKKAKPNSAKGSYIKGITITSTMGPGIKVNF